MDNCAGCAVDVHVVKEDTTNPLQQLIGEMAKVAPTRLFCTGVREVQEGELNLSIWCLLHLDSPQYQNEKVEPDNFLPDNFYLFTYH